MKTGEADFDCAPTSSTSFKPTASQSSAEKDSNIINKQSNINQEQGNEIKENIKKVMSKLRLEYQSLFKNQRCHLEVDKSNGLLAVVDD